MFTCLGCDGEFTGPSWRSYCSNLCQRALERRQHVQRWLETGQAYAGSRAGHYVRGYLHEAQQGRCAVCDRDAVWLGQPLTLVLDHIDGDAENNHRENLRLVCPNCDQPAPDVQVEEPRPWAALTSAALRRRQVLLTQAWKPRPQLSHATPSPS